MGTTASQKKLFFNLRKVKGQIQALEEGDLQPRPGQARSPRRLGVPEEDVVSMNRRLVRRCLAQRAGARRQSEGEWQDWLVDDTDNQETRPRRERGS